MLQVEVYIECIEDGEIRYSEIISVEKATERYNGALSQDYTVEKEGVLTNGYTRLFFNYTGKFNP
jgi:hypothetical protein